jgi:hypothetical protein
MLKLYNSIVTPMGAMVGVALTDEHNAWLQSKGVTEMDDIQI